MKSGRFPWKKEYQFVESGITADGVRTYPFDPAFPLDVSFLTGSGRHLVRMNRHEFFEVLYMFSGRTEIQIRSRCFHLKKGDVVVIGPDIYHRLLHKPHPEVKLISLNFQPEVIRSGEAEGESERYLSPFLCQGPQFPHVISGSRALLREVSQFILKIHEELPPRTTLQRLAAKTYMKGLLLLLLRHFADHLGTREAVDRKQRHLQRLQPLFQLLDQSYGEYVEVADAARVCAMSASHFMRFFKQTMGQPFRAYLSAFRIAKAQLMLSDGEASIADISQQVGFCSQSYFGEIFRALVGMTPRAYRQRFRAKAQSL
jgi:AraC-like DNA-binding protein